MSDWITDFFVFQENLDSSVKFSNTEDLDDGVFYLPKSQIDCEENFENLNPGEVIQVSIPYWLAKEKGLI